MPSTEDALLRESSVKSKGAAVAWVAASLYFFYQYVLRSAPSVMIPELSAAFKVNAIGVASILGLFYYGYSPFALVAGAAMDRLGPKKVLPIAAAVVAAGAFLFATGSAQFASAGRLLQGMGGVFAPVGAIYIAMKYFPASQAATLIGATQMFGMAGGAAGQFAVGSLVSGGLAPQTFWNGMALASVAMGAVLYISLPKQKPTEQVGSWLEGARGAVQVLKNPQSILCGLIAGLLFIPTTIFDMVWGVRYLQEAHGLDYASAIMRSAAVPFGWIIGCPLLGWISDRLGRRKPVIVGGALLLMVSLAWILFGTIGRFPPYSIGLLAGVASGAAMLPYTVIKEANPPHLAGTATGVINFLNFTFSALLGPVFGWVLRWVSRAETPLRAEHYQMAFAPLLLGVAFAIGFAFLLKETGSAEPQPG